MPLDARTVVAVVAGYHPEVARLVTKLHAAPSPHTGISTVARIQANQCASLCAPNVAEGRRARTALRAHTRDIQPERCHRAGP